MTVWLDCHYNYSVTLCNRVLVGKLIIDQLIKEFPSSHLEQECMLHCSQPPTIGAHCEPCKFVLFADTQFLKICIHIPVLCLGLPLRIYDENFV